MEAVIILLLMLIYVSLNEFTSRNDRAIISKQKRTIRNQQEEIRTLKRMVIAKRQKEFNINKEV